MLPPELIVVAFATPPEDAFSGTLMPFQQQGLAFLDTSPRALLADEMGLGKTVQALAALALTRALPALVVAPPHLMRNWARETQRFLKREGGVGRRPASWDAFRSNWDGRRITFAFDK